MAERGNRPGEGSGCPQAYTNYCGGAAFSNADHPYIYDNHCEYRTFNNANECGGTNFLDYTSCYENVTPAVWSHYTDSHNDTGCENTYPAADYRPYEDYDMHTNLPHSNRCTRTKHLWPNNDLGTHYNEARTDPCYPEPTNSWIIEGGEGENITDTWIDQWDNAARPDLCYHYEWVHGQYSSSEPYTDRGVPYNIVTHRHADGCMLPGLGVHIDNLVGAYTNQKVVNCADPTSPFYDPTFCDLTWVDGALEASQVPVIPEGASVGDQVIVFNALGAELYGSAPPQEGEIQTYQIPMGDYHFNVPGIVNETYLLAPGPNATHIGEQPGQNVFSDAWQFNVITINGPETVNHTFSGERPGTYIIPDPQVTPPNPDFGFENFDAHDDTFHAIDNPPFYNAYIYTDYDFCNNYGDWPNHSEEEVLPPFTNFCNHGDAFYTP